MSAKNRGTPPTPHDVHSTPAWVVHRILEAIPLPSGRWLEPCAGDGAIIRAVGQRRQERWTAVEIRGEGERCVQWVASSRVWANCDFLGWSLTTGLHDCFPYDVALMNPPFTLAREFVDACRRIATNTVALLRLNFLGSEERADWWKQAHPRPDIYVLPNRPSFSGNGKTDATEYCWVHWGPTAAGRWSILRSTPREERMLKP